jgi:hypothetical protein
MTLPPDQFVALLTSAQSQIYGFIGRTVIERIRLLARLATFVG